MVISVKPILVILPSNWLLRLYKKQATHQSVETTEFIPNNFYELHYLLLLLDSTLPLQLYRYIGLDKLGCIVETQCLLK